MSANGRGSKVDGGIVRLNPGTHYADNAGIWSEMPTVNEWVTITTAAGRDHRQHDAGAQLGTFVTSKLAVRGITLDRSDGGGVVLDSMATYSANDTVWVDGCRMIGSGQFNRSSSLLGQQYGNIYMTECSISHCDYPTLNSNASYLARGLAIENISNDAFQNVPMVVNCTVDNIRPGRHRRPRRLHRRLDRHRRGVAASSTVCGPRTCTIRASGTTRTRTTPRRWTATRS